MVDNNIRDDIRRVGGLAAIDFEREGSPISPDQLGTLIGHFDKIQELSRLAKSTESKSVPAPLRMMWWSRRWTRSRFWPTYRRQRTVT